MATVYYPSFDVILIDRDGRRVPVYNADVDAYNLTATASEGTVTSDEFGRVEEGSFTADVNDVVEFTVSGYSGVLRFTLKATQEEAYTVVENAANCLIVANEYATTNESQLADVYVTDDSDPTIPPQKIGTAKAGEQAVIPYVVTAQKNLTLQLVAISVKGQQSATEFFRAETYSITVPAPSGVKIESLFDVFSDATTIGTSRETLSNYASDGDLQRSGDKIKSEYAGLFAANGNDKRLYIRFAGTDIFDSGLLTENGTDWKAFVTIMRASNTEARASVQFGSGVHHAPNYTAITGLDLDANSYDLKLDAETADNDGDATLKMGHGMLFPALPQVSFGAQLHGFGLSFAGGSITGYATRAELGGMALVFTPGDVNHYFFPSDPPPDPGDWEPLDPPEA